MWFYSLQVQFQSIYTFYQSRVEVWNSRMIFIWLIHLQLLSCKFRIILNEWNLLSAGLFRSGISQSGNAFCFWGVRESSIDYTYRLANALRCPVNESAAMVDCLRRLDPLLITYTESTLPVSHKCIWDLRTLIMSCDKLVEDELHELHYFLQFLGLIALIYHMWRRKSI